jgi:hypothetical protein
MIVVHLSAHPSNVTLRDLFPLHQQTAAEQERHLLRQDHLVAPLSCVWTGRSFAVPKHVTGTFKESQSGAQVALLSGRAALLSVYHASMFSRHT